MIRSLELENYRGFRRFTMRGLGRVNLIVGTNNVGKTSVLEAFHIVEAPGDSGPLWSILTRRGEDTEDREGATVPRRQVDIRRLFYGHEISIGKSLQIRTQTDRGVDSFHAFIAEDRPDDEKTQPSLLEPVDTMLDSELLSHAMSLALRWQHGQTGVDISATLDLSTRGGLGSEVLRQLGRSMDGPRFPVRFITPSSLSPEVVIDLFEDIVLTPGEELVLDALRIIEPTIERIATSGTERRRGSSSRVGARGGLLVRCQGIKDRIPIGSMGDGVWRMLGLALALARTEKGILLVDEIDTGLHYSVMENMWKLVSHTATRLETQVIATTHSRDCYESLAAISRNVGASESEITMQRIERDKVEAVAYSEREIIAAAKRHLEVR